ncbi:hypothetical protein Slin_1555 [Spirosoma linguale DSM 74]|uniref:PIN domain-containing protein n=1 Tax=Spirosoma linguale (strain ATCC 33905 / DSM 74 / LMG 10896 / Claus 1) TaxID=504472 RepID=D2QNZ8_SPILD|nr:hypothetical protein Slin_1555 [Spirosoma linguale DSM 74]
MNGNKSILIDTNALIYYFNGNEKVTKAIDSRFSMYLLSLRSNY